MRVTGTEVTALLPTITAYGKNTVQTFDPRGFTDYTDAGGDSAGYWQARGDQYCSNWPPSSTWTCYDASIDDEDPERLIWTGDSGVPTINRMEEKDAKSLVSSAEL